MSMKTEIEIGDQSLGNSEDGEVIGMVNERNYECAEDRIGPNSQSLFDINEDNTTFSFRELPSGAIAYKIVQMENEEVPNNSPSHLIQGGKFFVIGNQVQVIDSNASPKKPVLKKEPIQPKTITKKRDDKRRATHNEVERRRRDKINSWITKLADMLPNNGLTDTVSKGGILAKACDHIAELTDKTKKYEKLKLDNEKLMSEIIRLNQELSEVRRENASMQNQLADNCILMPQKLQKS